jgi:predicted PurR-regulated permease PerM
MSFPPPTEKQARLIWLALSGLAIAALVSLVVALFWGLGQVVQMLSPVLWPLAVAGVIAYLLDPVVDRLEKRIHSRAKAILCVFGLALLIVGAVFGSIVPQIVIETRQFVRRIPEITAWVEARVQRWADNPPPLVQQFLKMDKTATVSEAQNVDAATNLTELSVSTNAANTVTTTNNPSLLSNALDKDTLQSATGWVAQVLPKAGRWLYGQAGRVVSWFGVVAGLLLVPVYAFYLLLEKRGIKSNWTDYLPVSDSKFKEEMVFVLRSINDYLIAFFRGQVLVALCDSVLYTVGFLVIGLPYAVLLGFAAVFLTLIPFLGAIVLCVTALVIALVQYGDWLHPLCVLGVFTIVQALEGLVISPKIMGGRVGLHPLAIIIAVMAGTTLLGGILGGILAIPLTAVLRVLMARYVWKKRKA